MTWKQGLVVLAGIILAISLYFLRSTPEQSSALEKQIEAASQELTEEELNYLEQLENQYRQAESDSAKSVVMQRQVHVWDSLGSPSVAALFAYKTTEYDTSVGHLVHVADHLVEAGETNRSNEEEQNLTFFFYETAGKLYQRVLKKSPGNEEALIGSAIVEIQGKGNVMEGVQKLLGIIEKDPLNVNANLTLGRLNMVNGQYPKAIDRMSTVLKTDSLNLSALTTIANAYVAMGKTDSAVFYYEKALKATNNEELKNTIQNRLKDL